MTNFEKFLRINGLKKMEIAEFLGVSKAFVTQLCNGTKALPNDKYKLIKSKAEWNADILDDKPTSIVNNNNNTLNVTPETNKEQMDQLIQSLFDRINSLEAQIDWMQGIIDRLTSK